MSNWATVCALTFAWVVILYVRKQYLRNAKHRPLPLPPGPPGLPWLGNIIGINASAPWLTYSEWGKTYGNLIYSRLVGNDIIIINSEEIARDLLERRNYSDRPFFLTNELCGIGFNTVMLPYGDRWRRHRRLFHQTFRPGNVSRFQSLQDRKSCQLLQRLRNAPEKLSDHVFEFTVSIVLNSVYDYDPQSEDDELVNMVAKVLEIVVPAVGPQVAILVGAIPAILNLPSWLPGMSFKKKMEIAKELSEQYVERPFMHLNQTLPSAGSTPSMLYDAFRNAEEKEIPRGISWMKDLKEAAATAFLAASETSNSVLMTFFLMMAVCPEVQERAQAQIDVVTCKKRLPMIDDRPLLPYVDAILREVLRYSPPIPLSVPRATIDDDVCAGFHIPKGAIVMVNLWSMTHDESKYKNPHLFLPERFLNDNGSLKPDDGESIVFGFGRRICPGKHLAITSVWSVIAKVLAVFKILNPQDENGVDIPVEPKFSGGPAVHPLPFQCRIVSRFEGMDAEKLEELITDH